MTRSDKFALFLCAALGAFFLMIAIAGTLGGAFAFKGSSGVEGLFDMWLLLCLIFIAPIWLFLRACGAIFGNRKQDEPFIERHSGW